MLIDTHCHLHDAEWFTPAQQADFLADAHKKGVEKIIVIGTDPENSLNARDFAEKHENVYWTYGMHPEAAGKASGGTSSLSGVGKHSASFSGCAELTSEHEVREARDDGPERHVPEKDGGMLDGRMDEKRKVFEDKLVAIGEIGLDYHYDGYNRAAQIKLFEQMLQLAKDLHLPVALHIREAFADAFAVLDNFPGVTGVVHSFTGSKKELKKALERDFYIGVNGLCTYTTNPLPPLEKMLLETDAPFLTPNPFRGTINSPAYVKIIATYLAGALGVDETVIMEQTTKNARKVFKI